MNHSIGNPQCQMRNVKKLLTSLFLAISSYVRKENIFSKATSGKCRTLNIAAIPGKYVPYRAVRSLAHATPSPFLRWVLDFLVTLQTKAWRNVTNKIRNKTADTERRYCQLCKRFQGISFSCPFGDKIKTGNAELLKRL